MPISTSEAIHQAVLLRIGMDESDLARSVEASKKYFDEFQKIVHASGTKIATSMETTTRKVDETGNAFQVAFGGRPRFTALSFLSSQLSGLTSDLVGTDEASRTLVGGFSMVQSGAMALGATMPYVLGASVALTGALAILKLTTDENSDAFKKYRDRLKEAGEEQKRFQEDIKKYEENVAVFNKLKFAFLTFVDIIFMYTDFAGDYAKRATKEFREAMRGLLQEQEKNIKLLQLQIALEKEHSIPNLKAMVEYYQKEYDAFVNIIGPREQTIESMEKELELLKKLRDAEEKLENERKRIADEEEKRQKEKEEKIKKEQEEMEKFLKYMANVMKIEAKAEEDARKEREKKQEEEDKKRRKDHEAWVKAIEERQRAFQSAVQSYARTIADTFASSFMGVENAWSNMINNMIQKFISAGFEAMIMSILFPGGSGFMKFFTSILGFQYGTPYVPKTGVYVVHRGERITPAWQNISNVRNYGGATTNYYWLNLNVEKLTQKQIIPLIEKMSKSRQTRILTA